MAKASAATASTDAAPLTAGAFNLTAKNISKALKSAPVWLGFSAAHCTYCAVHEPQYSLYASTRAPLSQQPASPMCVCKPGWSGIDCETPVCPNGCGGHGSCDAVNNDGTCDCSGGWSGSNCTVAPHCIAVGCGEHGACNTVANDGSCACTKGWSGASCEIVPICQSSGCNGRGQCNNATGKCICEGGYTGDDCAGPAAAAAAAATAAAAAGGATAAAAAGAALPRPVARPTARGGSAERRGGL